MIIWFVKYLRISEELWDPSRLLRSIVMTKTTCRVLLDRSNLSVVFGFYILICRKIIFSFWTKSAYPIYFNRKYIVPYLWVSSVIRNILSWFIFSIKENFSRIFCLLAMWIIGLLKEEWRRHTYTKREREKNKKKKLYIYICVLMWVTPKWNHWGWPW